MFCLLELDRVFCLLSFCPEQPTQTEESAALRALPCRSSQWGWKTATQPQVCCSCCCAMTVAVVAFDGGSNVFCRRNRTHRHVATRGLSKHVRTQSSRVFLPVQQNTKTATKGGGGGKQMINTGNNDKFRDFEALFAVHSIVLDRTAYDLREIQVRAEKRPAHFAASPRRVAVQSRPSYFAASPCRVAIAFRRLSSSCSNHFAASPRPRCHRISPPLLVASQSKASLRCWAQADAMAVAAHKATTAGLNIITEDTSLDVEGAAVGVNVKQMLGDLPSYKGKKATWRVLLAVMVMKVDRAKGELRRAQQSNANPLQPSNPSTQLVKSLHRSPTLSHLPPTLSHLSPTLSHLSPTLRSCRPDHNNNNPDHPLGTTTTTTTHHPASLAQAPRPRQCTSTRG